MTSRAIPMALLFAVPVWRGVIVVIVAKFTRRIHGRALADRWIS